MAKKRLFDLPQTRGVFQVRGHALGTEKDNFYKETKTRAGNDFRRVNFGVTYDDKATIYVDINGNVRDKVYFSRRNPDTKKNETKEVSWSDRNKFKEDGYSVIGVSCGLEQKKDDDGKVNNVVKNLVEYDACAYVNAYLKDDMDVFVSGNIEFSSFTNQKGDTSRRVNYRPTKIYACKKPVDFEEEGYEPQHDFKQTIVFRDIEQENDGSKDTGRFVLSAWIVTYNSIETASFIVENKNLASLFKKNLKEYNAISVHGRIDCRAVVEEVSTEDVWGERSKMDRINHPVVREMIITGADPASIDKDSYTEKEMNAALEAIRKAKNAEDNFADKNDDGDDWGSSDNFGDSDELPW